MDDEWMLPGMMRPAMTLDATGHVETGEMCAADHAEIGDGSAADLEEICEENFAGDGDTSEL